MKKTAALLFIMLIVAGCDIPFSEPPITTKTKVLRNENGFAVISEQHAHRHEGGGVTEYGMYSFKINGRTVDNEVIAKLLFPDSIVNCHSSLYAIDDIRLLPDNSVLALMSQSQSGCNLGQRFVARIYVHDKSGRIMATRIPLDVDGLEVGASADVGLFYRFKPDGFSYGYESNDERLEVLMQPNGIVGVATSSGETFLFDLETIRMVNVGKGKVLRFEENNKVALLHSHDREANTSTFRAVRVADGSTLDSRSYRADCYRPASEAAREIAISHYAMLAQDEEINRQIESMAKQPVESNTPEPLPNNIAHTPDAAVQNMADHFERAGAVQFNSDKLSGITLTASNWAVQTVQERETHLDWNIDRQKLSVTISPGLRKINGCRQ